MWVTFANAPGWRSVCLQTTRVVVRTYPNGARHQRCGELMTRERKAEACASERRGGARLLQFASLSDEDGWPGFMRIHHFEGADRSLHTDSRPPASMPPPREATRSVTVMISEDVRALVSALTRSLAGTAASQIQDILAHADRRMLACALSLVHAQGALGDLDALVHDLAAHRLAVLAPRGMDLLRARARLRLPARRCVCRT